LATRKLQKLAPTGDKEKKALEDTLEELQQGTLIISDRQKCIHIADQSVYHWRTVDAYKKALLAGSEEEDKRWKGAEKSIEQDVLRERQRMKPRGPPPVVPVTAEWGISLPPRPSFGQPLMNGPPPIPIPIPGRRVGPCYVCGQFEHLKRNCPRLLSQQYPFHSNVVDIPHTVCDSGNAGSVVCVNVSVSGGKSKVRANDLQLSMVLALPVRNLKA